MTTNVRGSVGRDYNRQLVHYLRYKIAGSAGAKTYTLGYALPKGADVLQAYTVVRVVFDGTPTLAIGTSGGTTTDIAAAATNGLATLGRNAVALAATAASATMSADKVPTLTIGGAPTVGDADVIIEYVPQNDA